MEPLLYSSIKWKWETGSVPPIQLFLRSILNRPELGDHVRIIELTGNSWDKWRAHPPPKIPVNDAGLDIIEGAIERLKVPFSELWISELRSGTMDAFVAVLLSKAPKVETLTFSPEFTKEFLIMGQVLRAALFEPRITALPRFDHLKRVSYNDPVDGELKNRICNTVDVLTLFYLPSIQNLCARVENPAALAWPTTAPDSSSLTTLTLAQAREPLLGHILSVTTGLRSLQWHWVHEVSTVKSDLQNTSSVIDLGRFAQAISQVRGTLSDLVITAYVDAHHDEPEICIIGDLTSLVSFDNLVYVEVPVPVIMGTFSINTTRRLEDTLPRNIEHLALTDDFLFEGENEWDSDDIFRLLESWLDSKCLGQASPRLGRISTKIWRDGRSARDRGEWGRPMREKVRGLCAAAGVDYGVVFRSC